MKQARLFHRLGSLLLFGVLGTIISCQQAGPLQGTVKKPADKKSEQKSAEVEDADAERITPPNNIVGSYLVCQEQEQLSNLDQNAVLQCGVYVEPAHVVRPVAKLEQWQLSGSTALLRAVSSDSASLVELRFQAADLVSLKAAVKAAKLHVKDDNGNAFEGVVADLMPPDSRLATANAAKTVALTSLWNEGFETTPINTDGYLYFNPSLAAVSTTTSWVNDTIQNPACGKPILEVFRFATQTGGFDAVGAAEGTQFLDTDSACWPDSLPEPIRGESNLTIGKELNLIPGRVYRVSFKVRQQPMPDGAPLLVQGLQLKINQTVVKDLRTFTAGWQEITFDWIARSGVNRIEWSDVGAADDSIGVLLDDLRVQVQNF